MDAKFFGSMINSNQVYTSLWNKYRPAIVQLMVASAEGPQQYKMYGHEFKALNSKEKKGYAFKLHTQQAKAVNNIKESMLAQDLLYILKLSRKASELMEADGYEFMLDKHFMFHITKL